MYTLLIHKQTELPTIVFNHDPHFPEFIQSGNYVHLMTSTSEYFLKRYEAFLYLTLTQKNIQMKTDGNIINLFWELSKVDEKTLWGLAIANTFKHFTFERYRELIDTLHSQGFDNSSRMENLIGTKAFQLILTIKQQQ